MSTSVILKAILTLSLCLGLVMTHVQARPSHIGFPKVPQAETDRLRRNFKSSALATARGFGKRAEVEGIAEDTPSLGSQRFKTSSVTSFLINNPSLIQSLVERYLDLDEDGYIGVSDLKILV